MSNDALVKLLGLTAAEYLEFELAYDQLLDLLHLLILSIESGNVTRAGEVVDMLSEIPNGKFAVFMIAKSSPDVIKFLNRF